MGSVIDQLHLFSCLFKGRKAFQSSFRISISQIYAIIVVGILQRWISSNFCQTSVNPLPNFKRNRSLLFKLLYLQFNRNIFHINLGSSSFFRRFLILGLSVFSVFVNCRKNPLLSLSLLIVRYLIRIDFNGNGSRPDIASGRNLCQHINACSKRLWSRQITACLQAIFLWFPVCVLLLHLYLMQSGKRCKLSRLISGCIFHDNFIFLSAHRGVSFHDSGILHSWSRSFFLCLLSLLLPSLFFSLYRSNVRRPHRLQEFSAPCNKGIFFIKLRFSCFLVSGSLINHKNSPVMKQILVSFAVQFFNSEP